MNIESDFSFQCLSHSQQENTLGKEMAEKRTRSMSVELAIQRELAYRKKIEELQLQQYDDSGYEIMSLPKQVQFLSRNPTRADLDSSPRLSEREHLASLSNPECLSSPRPNQNPSSRPNICSDPRISERKQLVSSSKNPSQQLQPSKGCNLNHQSVNFFCEVCQVPCSGSLNYKQHLSGKKHKVKFQELKFGRKYGGDSCAVVNQKSWCKLCKIWCTDDNLLKQHLAGQKHKKMQEKLERATTAEGEQNWCELCGIGCSSKELLQFHFNGKKHQAELRKLEYAQKGGEEAVNQQKKCKLCDTWCADKSSLLMNHMEKKHFLYEIEVKKRQWQELIRDEGNS